MLAGLARWLRAAGHNTALPPAGADDEAVLAIAQREHRTLLTRDGRLAAQVGGAVRLTSDGMDAQAAELATRLDLNWTAAPFTRCLLDNHVLHPAGAQDIARVPPSARDLAGPFMTCPHCCRIYWPGSHVRRMLARLEGWRSGV